MNRAAMLSFACGFASLSVEILWVRFYGFAKLSTPAAFGFVLAAYLVGIGIGARLGASACRQGRSDAWLWGASIVALLVSAVLTVALPLAYGALVLRAVENPLLDVLLIALASAVLSFVFPIAHHLGTKHFAENLGRRFATVYVSNVLGAALGPLVTGYILLDQMTLQASFLVLAALQAMAALFLLVLIPLPAGRALLRAGAVAVVIATAALGALLPAHWLLQGFTHDERPPKTVVENRQGIVTIFEGRGGDDVVYGGNVYDGRTNLDGQRNSNGLERPLLTLALQPQPRRVLMVGLSIGTWLALVREFPGVESIDVVEINPGYIEAAQAYGPQARALLDPRVNLVIDDARRWLRHHPERRYDLIIMNTTWHWRSNTTLLVSCS